tara:strand:- start:530 stop:658 length:129 start_codon:yes stop_codon:yes gene_type:complete
LDGFICGAGGTNLLGIGTFTLSALHILGEQIGIITGASEHTG